MRSEVQPADTIRAFLSVIVAGAGVGGLSPTAVIYRKSDAMYFDGATWSGAPTPLAMVAGPFTGHYEYIISPAAINYAAGEEGYLMEITVPGTLTEHVHVTPMYDPASFDLDSTLSIAESIKRMTALRQDNVRVVYDAWSTDGKPTHGMAYIYNSKAALEADTGPAWAAAVGSYEIDASYDGSLRPTEYTSTRES